MKKRILLWVLTILTALLPCAAYGSEESERPEEETTLDVVLGTSREQIVAWLTSHEKDDYYLGTPYRDFSRPWDAEWCVRPYGRFAGNEPQMNCSGFVIDVLQQCGVKEQALIDMADWVESNGIYYDTDGGGYVDADYFYFYTVCHPNIRSYSFSTVQEMLDSGVLQKGDLIYFQPYDYTLDAGYDAYGNEADCHIGFFWGDTPEDNVFWHSNLSGAVGVEGAESVTVDGNQMSLISPCSQSMILVIPLSDPLPEPEPEPEPEEEPEKPSDILEFFLYTVYRVDGVIESQQQPAER